VCAITGTTGYVGSRVASHLATAGWDIRALSRSDLNGSQSAFTHVRFELGRDLGPEALAGADTLVHLAYDFSFTRWPDIERVNVEGSLRLFAAARRMGLERIVFVSSVAAFAGARSLYGRAKLEIERAALDMGATVIRPGLVWGPQGEGGFGALRRIVLRTPVVPILVPAGLELNLVHEEDLAALVERVLEQWPQSSGKLFVAASRPPVTFVELVRSLGPRDGRPRRLVRLPWRAAWLALRTLELAGASPPFRSDSLVSLVAADSAPLAHATDSAERYGVRWRPYALE
jgi:nucleoside-diphosphate-sugar epimerase